jgi:hypothetical protein
MLADEREKILHEYLDKELKILVTKGREYASEEDTLSNFKTVAYILNAGIPMTETCECGREVNFEITPKIVLMVYLIKHLLSMLDYAGREETLSEDISGRVLDLRVYAMLFDCLIRDEN